MNWHLVAIINALLSSTILALVYFSLSSQQHEKKDLRFMSIGWAIHSLRYLLMIISLLWANNYLAILSNISAHISTLFLLLGGSYFCGKKIPSAVYYLFFFILLWILASFFLPVDILWQTIPNFTFAGTVLIWLGIIYFKNSTPNNRKHSLAQTILAVTLIIWGLHKLNYPFLSNNSQWSILGHSFTASLSLIVAATMLLTYYEHAYSQLTQKKDSLEEKFEEKKITVTQTNEDLANFAHTVSHDLKAPLRAITTLAQFIYEDNEAKLDQESRHNFQLLIERAKKMHQQINNILEYSEAGASANNTNSLVNLNIMLPALLKFIDCPAHIKISYDTLPIIRTSSQKIEQIFQNLILNAIQYISDKSGEIKISATARNAGWLFAVSDNGVGIPADCHKKIFQLFTRCEKNSTSLHLKSDEHIGVGLAICKKLVNSLGGDIWVESEVGQGATFYF